MSSKRTSSSRTSSKHKDHDSGKYYEQTKIIKLKTHPRNFCEEDLVVNLDSFTKDKFTLWEGIVIELFPVDERKSNQRKNHLLLEVKKTSPDVQAKGGPLSISQEVAQAFNLNGLREVCIRRVDKQQVGLDLVEFRFKDQGLSRSDMWRFTNSLIDKGMYMTRKLLFAGMLLKVSGLWAKGDTVKSGVVINTTRVVFRSASSQFFLFLQVSSEIWEFDPNGDTYFDKAIDGFLKDLFSHWKEKECNHQVTLIFFARKYSKTKNFSGGGTAQRDKCSRYYQDYYHTVFQSESRNDWSSAIVEVKKSFLNFQHLLSPNTNLNKDDSNSSSCDEWISTSAEGNILEATNLAINVLETHYKECSFDTTGQQIVIVSSGAGVFEVDSELSKLTKERIIDQGIGMDLVCLNEQPLHAVPLFKFYQGILPDERYHIPHWINYSYYNPVRPWNRFRYQPRIKISDCLVNKLITVNSSTQCNNTEGHPELISSETSLLLDPNDPLSLNDYEKYDANIFTTTLPSKHHSLSDDVSTDGVPSAMHSDEIEMDIAQDTWKTSPANSLKSSSKTSIVKGGKIPRTRYYSDNYEDQSFDDVLPKIGSAENFEILINRQQTPKHRRKRLFIINPFDPSKSHIEASSYHCRWMHTFPRDLSGRAFQTHHVTKQGLEKLDENNELNTHDKDTNSSLSSSSTGDFSSNGTFLGPNATGSSPKKSNKVENFASVRRAGMDWTSFTEPACLPLTTDYYPDKSIIARDYEEFNSQLLVSNIVTGGEDGGGGHGSSVSGSWRADHSNVSTVEAFKEMISQRLAQGFQLVFSEGSLYTLHKDLTSIDKKKSKNKDIHVMFSLGRVFQTISLSYPEITTHIYKLKNTLPAKQPFKYKYKLITESNQETVSSMSCKISQEMREKYNWNFLDQHVCGYVEFEQYQESHKYLRCRLLLLPSTPPPQGDLASKWCNEMTSGFEKFIELMNNIKRTPPNAKKKTLDRLNSFPARTSSSSSISSIPPFFFSQQTSPCTSPSPTFNKSHSVTPSRSNSDPHSSPKMTRISVTERSLRRAKSPDPPSSFKPHLLSSSSTSRRNSSEVVKDLRELTTGSGSSSTLKRSSSPNPYSNISHKPSWRSSSIENLYERETISELNTPSLHLVPSTPTGLPPPLKTPLEEGEDDGESDLQSPLDYPSGFVTIESPVERILYLLLDKDDGVDQLVNQPLLRNNCFISMEAVNWLEDKLHGNPTRKDIIKLMKRMTDTGTIVHASGDRSIPFYDGYYFYYAPEMCSSEEEGKDMDYESFSKKWFQVVINQTERHSQNGGGGSATSSRTSSFQSSPTVYYMHTEEHISTPADRQHYVEFNPDQKCVSDRPEWCYIHYKDTYYQRQGYPLEFQWMACTLSLLYKLIQNWTYKAAMCNFNLVPVLSLSTLGLLDSSTSGSASDTPHPFVQSTLIHLKVPSQYQIYFEDTSEDHSDALRDLFLKILDKFGFLLDPSSVIEMEEPSRLPKLASLLTRVYIHYSGTVILQPVYETKDKWPNYGFRWLPNSYFLRQKSTSQSSLNKYDELWESFRTFCMNADELSNMCSEIVSLDVIHQ